MDAYQRQFLYKASLQAEQSGHIFPLMASCEAALESGYGVSGLAIADNNLFGMKQHKHPIYGTHVLPTREYINGEWVIVDASWVKYPSWKECFQDRMATLTRLQRVFPHYAAALSSTDPIAYVTEVSKTWSTDPHRANKVIAIYNAYGV